jgi:hypothetical protein
MDFIERLDKVIEGGLERLVQRSLGSHGGVEFLEAYAAALDDIAAQIRSLGRRRVFPFKRVTLRFALQDSRQIPAVSHMLSQRRLLVEEVRRRLQEAGCEPPSPLRVDGEAAGEMVIGRDGKTYEVLFATELPAQPALTLKVLKGRSERRTYVFTHETVNLGRGAEVLDDSRRVVRRNQVIFADGDYAVNATVSRLHGHVTFDPEVGWYRLFDDRSRFGTRIYRGGRVVEIAPGVQMGAWLRSGDEIHLGEARVSVAVADEMKG